MSNDTTRRGLVGVSAVMMRLVELGYEVLLPWGEGLPYDLAYYWETTEHHFGFFKHIESGLARIQVKVAWLSKEGDAILFNTAASPMKQNGKWKRTGYAGRADWFGVYSPDTRKVYMVSVKEASKGNMKLRLYTAEGERLISAQQRDAYKYTKWAKDYEI